MRVFHRTTQVAADAILTGGFSDGEGTYMTEQVWRGVWVSDRPLDANENAWGDVFLTLTIPSDVFTEYEWVQTDWVIARVLSRRNSEPLRTPDRRRLTNNLPCRLGTDLSDWLVCGRSPFAPARLASSVGEFANLCSTTGNDPAPTSQRLRSAGFECAYCRAIEVFKVNHWLGGNARHLKSASQRGGAGAAIPTTRADAITRRTTQTRLNTGINAPEWMLAKRAWRPLLARRL